MDLNFPNCIFNRKERDLRNYGSYRVFPVSMVDKQNCIDLEFRYLCLTIVINDTAMFETIKFKGF